MRKGLELKTSFEGVLGQKDPLMLKFWGNVLSKFQWDADTGAFLTRLKISWNEK